MAATQQDIEQLIAAQCHIGSKNIQVCSGGKGDMEGVEALELEVKGLWKLGVC